MTNNIGNRGESGAPLSTFRAVSPKSACLEPDECLLSGLGEFHFDPQFDLGQHLVEPGIA